MDEMPSGAVEAGMRAAYDAWPQTWKAGGPAKTYEECYGQAPLEHKDDADEARVCLDASLSWLVENDPGFLLRLVFSQDELEQLESVSWSRSALGGATVKLGRAAYKESEWLG